MTVTTEGPVEPIDAAPARRFGVHALLAVVALALVAVPFALLMILVRNRWDPLTDLDLGASRDLNHYALQHPGFVSAMQDVSFVGSAPVYAVVFGVVAVWLLWRRLPRLALFVVVTMLGSSLLNGLVKAAVDRARPVLPEPVAHANGLSFPSGHAQSAMAAASVLLLVFLPALRGRWRPAAVVAGAAFVLAVGFARVSLGVHFVSDVLGGYVLGLAWVAATTAAFSAWRRERGRPAVDASLGLEPEHARQLDPRTPQGDVVAEAEAEAGHGHHDRTR